MAKAKAQAELTSEPKADCLLIVREPFGNYKRGDQIADIESIKKVLESTDARHVAKVLVQNQE